MRELSAHMGMYAAYHRHPMNRAIHFVMVPAIVWTLMVALNLLPLARTQTMDITAATLITVALLAWYLVLDLGLGIAAVAVFTAMYVSSVELIEAVGGTMALWIAGAVFVGSWVFQLLGHGVWERRRPALADNLFQVFVAPMFLIAETAFAMGLKRSLQSDVDRVMQQHLPA